MHKFYKIRRVLFKIQEPETLRETSPILRNLQH